MLAVTKCKYPGVLIRKQFSPIHLPGIKVTAIPPDLTQVQQQQVQFEIIQATTKQNTLENQSFMEDAPDVMINPRERFKRNAMAFMFQYGLTFVITMLIIASMLMQGKAISRQSQMFTSSKKAIKAEDVDTSFADVAGCENAKLELAEVVDFLKNPEKYTKVGAKIPKGCLLTGGPGLGKTLLARAVAGEAGVPFFATSASEFIELFVGVGSSRIRDLFKNAKEASPCIIFIDEIDAIGKSRASNGSFGSNDEREQTINQLLTEMDGFSGNKGIVVIGATNRPEILDKALVRPGRFDRQITLDPPSVKDREAILNIHCRDKPIAANVSLADIAANTVGLSGAELANIANEAAILAARRNAEEIEKKDFYAAIDRVLLGPEKTALISEEKRRIVACHEAGHAITALKVGEYDKLTKISIIPRGKTGGVTIFEPLYENIDSGLYSKQYLENRLVVALGGRAAEEIVFGTRKMTTGAYNDMEVVQQIARAMVVNYGFSDIMGTVSWSPDTSSIGLQQAQYSSYIQTRIDMEVLKLTRQAYDKAKNIIDNNYELFLRIAEQLYKNEVLTKDDIDMLIVR
jgi:cell division protease FtsH